MRVAHLEISRDSPLLMLELIRARACATGPENFGRNSSPNTFDTDSGYWWLLMPPQLANSVSHFIGPQNSRNFCFKVP